MGAKKIETRSWATTHRGPLLIHASKGRKGSIFSGREPFSHYIKDFTKLPFGFIIGEVQLVDVVPVNELRLSDNKLDALSLEEKAFGDYTEGRWAWILHYPIEYENPIPAAGMLGLWDYK